MKRATFGSTLVCTIVALAATGATELRGQAGTVLTPAQLDAKLAKVFELYSRGLPTLKIEEEIARATKANGGLKPEEITISNSRVQVSYQHVPSSELPRGIPVLLLEGVFNSDLVIKGVPISARTLPISDRTFLFTQYTVRVSWIFSDDWRGLSPGDTIIVSMGGGILTIDGVLIRAIDRAFDQLHLDEPVILMLKAVRGTNTYLAVAPGTFLIKDDLVKVASKIQPGRDTVWKSLSEFESDLGNAIAYARSRRK